MQIQQNPGSDKPADRFMSPAECEALAKRAASMAVGSGDMKVTINTLWTGNIRFARNQVISSGDLRNNYVYVLRDILGAEGNASINQINDIDLEAAVRRAERILRSSEITGGRQFREHFQTLDSTGVYNEQKSSYERGGATSLTHLIQTMEPYLKPKLFFDSTYNLGARERLHEIKPLIDSVTKDKLSAAGYIEAEAAGLSLIDTWGRTLYYPYTDAQFSVTVRDPDGTGSGWAGVDFREWPRIDAKRLTEIAIDKCLRSRNPVAIEPGRYTAILEPQAVAEIFTPVVSSLQRRVAEQGDGPFALGNGGTKVGLTVLDQRITVSQDPMDSDTGFVPFDGYGEVYHPATWIENGVLKALAYDRRYAVTELGLNAGLPNRRAYRMNGGDTTIDDMIASTKRGVLVTRFYGTKVEDKKSLLCTGFTRDGLWLIENGKISKAVKNFRFRESPLFIFNNLEMLGPAVKVFRPGYPTVCPSAKVRDFSFTSLIEAV